LKAPYTFTPEDDRNDSVTAESVAPDPVSELGNAVSLADADVPSATPLDCVGHRDAEGDGFPSLLRTPTRSDPRPCPLGLVIASRARAVAELWILSKSEFDDSLPS
jgi:hypothetical protein